MAAHPRGSRVPGDRHPDRQRQRRGERLAHDGHVVHAAREADRGQELPLAGPVGLVVRSGRSGAPAREPADLHGGRPHDDAGCNAGAGDPAGSTSVRFPTLQWTPVTSATRYLIYVRPVGTVLWTAVNDQFEYAAGEDRGTSWLAPDSYEWRVEAYNGATLLSTTQNSSTFVISSLTSVTGQRVALSGSHRSRRQPRAATPSTPPFLWPISSAWDLSHPGAHLGRAAERGSVHRLDLARPAAHQLDREIPHRAGDLHAAHRALRQPGRLCVLLARPAVQGRDILQAPRARGSRLQQALEARAAAVACRRVDGVQLRDVHVARLPGDQPGRDDAREPRRCVLRGAGRRGTHVPGAGRQRPELPVATRDDGRRPDHVHGIRRHLPRGAALLAGPGDRRVNQLAHVERGADLHQAVARRHADGTR